MPPVGVGLARGPTAPPHATPRGAALLLLAAGPWALHRPLPCVLCPLVLLLLLSCSAAQLLLFTVHCSSADTDAPRSASASASAFLFGSLCCLKDSVAFFFVCFCAIDAFAMPLLLYADAYAGNAAAAVGESFREAGDTAASTAIGPRHSRQRQRCF